MLKSSVFLLPVLSGTNVENISNDTDMSVFFIQLPTNIRLGWKALPGTNTLAYYDHL